MVRIFWARLILFDLQPHKNYNGGHIQGMHRVMLKYSHVLRAELVFIAEFTKTCPLADWCLAILLFQAGMDATLLNICAGA